ncbi:hypothetical protein ACFLRB_03395 [Acidobacteriota bacterium]
MVTREVLKKEIDNVQDQYLVVLYKIVKALETKDQWKDFEKEIKKQKKEVGKNNLVEFFEKSPLYNSGINLER